jgi:hypothetical protein
MSGAKPVAGLAYEPKIVVSLPVTVRERSPFQSEEQVRHTVPQVLPWLLNTVDLQLTFRTHINTWKNQAARFCALT